MLHFRSPCVYQGHLKTKQLTSLLSMTFTYAHTHTHTHTRDICVFKYKLSARISQEFFYFFICLRAHNMPLCTDMQICVYWSVCVRLPAWEYSLLGKNTTNKYCL